MHSYLLVKYLIGR